MGIFEMLMDRWDDLLESLLIHIEITLSAMVIAILIAVPLGIWLVRHRRYAELVIGLTSMVQTIPSLALLGFMIPLFGIGKEPALIALVLYALLPILRNTFIGIAEVDAAAIEAGIGMGMTRWQLLFMVQLPIALPVLIGGIRTATVWTVGVATLGALVGAGGLGDFIFRGIATANNQLILLGAIPAALLAVAFDTALRIFEKSRKIEKR
jgi:ABC-type proline/glycine betaine transport systems, permease component